MKDLDLVIAGLECCADLDRSCAECPYEHDEYCEVALMKDAVGYLKRMDDLRKDIWDRTNENHRLKRNLRLTRAQLNAAWDKIARITGERYDKWLSESGESVPEFPKEGM